MKKNSGSNYIFNKLGLTAISVSKDLTQHHLKSILNYEKDTGEFTWIFSGGGNLAGSKAGGVKSRGYIEIKICGFMYKAHRLAWLYVTGSWPELLIDHKNGIKTDNRFSNLREATCSQNQMNSKLRIDNKLGLKGVNKRKDGMYLVRVCINQKYKCEIYKNLKDAENRAKELRMDMHNDYHRHG